MIVHAYCFIVYKAVVFFFFSGVKDLFTILLYLKSCSTISMEIHKKPSAVVLPISSTIEPGTSSLAAVPVPENQQHENRSPALHAFTNSKSTGELQDPQEPLKTNIPRFSFRWFCRHWKSTFHTPRGVRPRHRFIVSWLGRIGFIAKGIVYAVMGGLCIATAQHLKGDITGTESPMVCLICLMVDIQK